MYMLIPPGLDIGVFRLVAVFIVATLLGFASHAPAGLGVFDATILIGLGSEDREQLLAALLMFRFLYHLVPLMIALALFGGVEALRYFRESEARASRSQTGELSFNPIMPATIRVRQRIRTVGRIRCTGACRRGCCQPRRCRSTPRKPYQTAVTSAIAISAKLKPIATTVARVGQNRVSPSECFRPSAHQPRAGPPQGGPSSPSRLSLSGRAMSGRHIARSPGMAVRISDRRQRPKPARTCPARAPRVA